MKTLFLLTLTSIILFSTTIFGNEGHIHTTEEGTRVLVVRAKVTGYCGVLGCRICNGKWADGKTATGRNSQKTVGIAVPQKHIPMGSWIEIPGEGTFLADDNGGAMRQSAKRGTLQIDRRFPSHRQALKWGVRYKDIRIAMKKSIPGRESFYEKVSLEDIIVPTTNIREALSLFKTIDNEGLRDKS